MLSKITIAALFAGIAAAYHVPVGDPSGNPITRPLNEIVPAGKPFTITWQPTTTNKVSLLLLKGPSTNVIPIETLVEGIDNSGSFTFTPSNSLEASSDATGYGIQLIDDVTGQYQYSTQFGVSVSEKPASSAEPVVSAAGYSVALSPSEIPAPASSAYATPVAPGNSTLSTVGPITTAYAPTGTAAPSASGSGGSYSAIQPSKPLTVPGSLLPTATGTPSNTTSPEITGAASSLQAGLGLAGAVAGLVFML